MSLTGRPLLFSPAESIQTLHLIPVEQSKRSKILISDKLNPMVWILWLVHMQENQISKSINYSYNVIATFFARVYMCDTWKFGWCALSHNMIKKARNVLMCVYLSPKCGHSENGAFRWNSREEFEGGSRGPNAHEGIVQSFSERMFIQEIVQQILCTDRMQFT